MRSSPFSENALAISRLPERSGFSGMNLRMSSRVGLKSPFGDPLRRADLPDWSLCRRSAAPRSQAFFLAAGFFAAGFLAAGFLAAPAFEPKPCGTASCPAALGGLLGDQRDRLLERHRHRVLALGQRRIDLLEIDIGSVFAVADGDLAAVRMLAQLLQRRRRSAVAAASALGLLLGDDRHGAVEADREHVLDAFEIGVGAVMQHERPVAAEAGGDHLAGFGMLADIARQRQQRQRLLVVDAVGRPALRQARALGLLAVAALHIGAEAAAPAA